MFFALSIFCLFISSACLIFSSLSIFLSSSLLYFLYDKSTFPKPSFHLITSAVIVSPGLNSSFGFFVSSSEYSFLGIIPSALYLKSTKISPFLEICITVPVILLSNFFSFNDSLYNFSKFSSCHVIASFPFIIYVCIIT